MKLNVLERILVLGGLLPKESDILTLKLRQSILAKVTFKEQELQDFEIKEGVDPETGEVQKGSYVWNQKGNEGVETDLTDKEISLIKEALLTLDKQKKLTPNHLSLYEKMVGRLE